MMLDFILVILAGSLATLAMTALMYSFHISGLGNGDMVRAIGSYVTKRYEGSLKPGLLIHFASGIFFAFLYFLAWRALSIRDPILLIITGALFGFLHGMVVSILLVIMVAEHHPLAKFRQVGFGVALTHVIAHILYGTTLGAIFGYATYLLM